MGDENAETSNAVGLSLGSSSADRVMIETMRAVHELEDLRARHRAAASTPFERALLD